MRHPTTRADRLRQASVHPKTASAALPFALCLGLAVGCVPQGRDVSKLQEPGAPIPLDGGFDDAGNPLDGGFVVPDTGPRPDGGPLPDLGPAVIVDPVYDNCDTFAHTYDVPVRVIDTSNAITRDPGVTSFLIPFARTDSLYSLNGLAVFDDGGNRLPAQFETMSRWNAHPNDCAGAIRYAYAHVRSAPTPGASATWYVRHPAGDGEEAGLSVAENPNQWVIDTGIARFTVRRDRFDGLSAVEVNTPGGWVTVSNANAGGGFRLEHNGEKNTADTLPWRLELERRGPQVVTVAARGFYGTGGSRDLAYTIRLHFYGRSGVVRVEHTYYHGEVSSFGVNGGDALTTIDRAYLRIPLEFQPSSVAARGATTVHALGGASNVELAQVKRDPQNDAVRFFVNEGGNSIESGGWARNPFVSATDGNAYVIATIGRMAERDPQGLRYDANARSIDVDFTSEPMAVGGARGIWSVAAIDFAYGTPNFATRGDSLRLQAERPLLGAADVAYVNGTNTMGPYAVSTAGQFAEYYEILDTVHSRSRQYIEDSKINGVQIWPDLPRRSCIGDGVCANERSRLYEGGDNNYWNWSKPGIDEFFRTGQNEYLYDFSLGEATTFTETFAFRLDHDRLYDSGVTGLAPCYGSSRGFGGPYREGLNNRFENCVADYTYNKTLKLAYLATADRRFVDYFEEAGSNALNLFGNPPQPSNGEELALFRLSEQRLELLTAGAEFGRDPDLANPLRAALNAYADFMLGRTLIDGHSCSTAGDISNSAIETGTCFSDQGWMHGTSMEWVLRTASYLGHEGLRQWLVRHGEKKAQFHTVLNGNGLPDYARSNAWKTMYICDTTGAGVNEGSCQKITNAENNGSYYDNDLVGFLNVFGMVLAADPSDPNRICQWLPNVFMTHLTSIDPYFVNDYVWGKQTGLSLGMSPEAVGAMSVYCP